MTQRQRELQNRILQCAYEAFCELPLSAITLEGIAFRAKCSKVTIYRRWKTLPRLLINCITTHDNALYEKTCKMLLDKELIKAIGVLALAQEGKS